MDTTDQFEKDIIDQFERYNIAYFEGNPLIPDEEYDEFVEKHNLRDVFPGQGIIAPDQIPIDIYGMDKIQKESEYDRWVKNIDKRDGFLISEKLDGVSVLVDVENMKAYTRGNTERGTGRDISWVLKHSDFEWLRDIDNITYIRGELILPKRNYEEIMNIRGIKNPLAFVSGYVNSDKNRDGELLELLNFRAFEVLFTISQSNSQEECDEPYFQFEEMKRRKIPHAKHIFISDVEFNDLPSILNNMRDISDFTIDGIIISSNTRYLRELRRNPKHSKAFKKISQEIAKVVRVDWNISENKRLVPVINIDPITISGKTYTKLTGKNASYIRDGKIGPGSLIYFGVNVVPVMYGICEETTAQMPTIDFEWKRFDIYATSDIHEDVNGAVYSLKLLAFFKKLKIKGVGEKNTNNLVADNIRTPLDFLSNDYEGKVLSDLKKNTIEKLKSVGIIELMDSSRVFDNISSKTLDLIVNNINLDDDLTTIESKLRSVKGLGDVKVRDFITNYPKFVKFRQTLEKYITITEESASKSLEFENIAPNSENNGENFEIVKYILSGNPPIGKKADFKKILPKNYKEVSTVNQADIVIFSADEPQTTKTKEAISRNKKLVTYESMIN